MQRNGEAGERQALSSLRGGDETGNRMQISACRILPGTQSLQARRRTKTAWQNEGVPKTSASRTETKLLSWQAREPSIARSLCEEPGHPPRAAWE